MAVPVFGLSFHAPREGRTLTEDRKSAKVSDSTLYQVAVRVAKELTALRSRLVNNSRDPALEPDAKAVAEVCRRFASDFEYELLERESYLGLVVKLTDPKDGQFCLIAPDEPPTQVEEKGTKAYTFILELQVRHTIEVEAEDLLEAQESVFDQIEELLIGECDEVSVGFLEDEESFGPGFSLN